jgi:hypothetical protein
VIRRSSTETDWVRVEVGVTSNVGVQAWIAVVEPEGPPDLSDWHAATLQEIDGSWWASLLVGPDGTVAPGEGTWAVWLRVDSGGQSVRTPVETLVVRDVPLRIVQPADVARYVDREIGQGDDVWLGDVIDMLTGELEAWLGRPVTVRGFTEDHRVDWDQWTLHLRRTPVVEVSGVVHVPSMAAVPASSYVVREWGLDFRPAQTWVPAFEARSVTGPVTLRVTYRAGIDGLREEAIRAALTRAAAREWLARLNDVQGLASASVEGTTYTPVEGMGAGSFLEADLQRLQRFRRRRVA